MTFLKTAKTNGYKSTCFFHSLDNRFLPFLNTLPANIFWVTLTYRNAYKLLNNYFSGSVM